MAVPFWLWMFAHIILASASTASSNPPNAALWGFTQWFCHSPKKHKLHPVKASKSSTKKCYYVPCPSLQTNKKNATKSNLHQQSFVFFLPAPSHGGALIFFGVGMAWAFTVVSSAKAAAIAAPTPKSGSSGTKDSAVGSSGTKEPKPGKASKIETSATAWVLAQKGMGGGLFFCEVSFRSSTEVFWLKKLSWDFGVAVVPRPKPQHLQLPVLYRPPAMSG